mmetsp:Transcript_7761/g.15225  ORF Transcript_7761/g.15225 Transcript_7761/m.15225 type:complete len:173 (+) Transcript_7761:102-620(+)
MGTGDGQRAIVDVHGKPKIVACTRWRELTETARQMAQLSIDLNARTDFLLLNENAEGKYLSICGEDCSSGVPLAGDVGDLTRLNRLLSPSPFGTTPITDSVVTIISMIEPAAETLRANGQQVVVVIATDGQPDDPAAFTEALRTLQRMPVWVVVRLCTSEPAIVTFWSELDK